MTFTLRSLLVVVILSVAIYVTYFSVGGLQETLLERPLKTLPETIGVWQLANQVTLDDKIVDILGVDEYVEKIYVSPEKRAIDLYVSYFNVLKEGKQFHSPKNCLIGSGSTLLEMNVVNIPIAKEGNSVPVGFMMLQKGDSTQLILYWFQCRGKIMHSEYEERVRRVLDAIFKKRTDGAFIRIIATDSGNDVKRTKESLIGFASQVIPVLQQFIPEA